MTLYLTIDDGCAEQARHVGSALPTEAAIHDALLHGQAAPMCHDMAYVVAGDDDMGMQELVYGGADYSAADDATLVHISTEEIVRDAYPLDPGQALQMKGQVSDSVPLYLDHCAPRFEKLEEVQAQ